MENNILPDFQKFLLSRGFVPAKNVPFYANWVSKFIAFSNHKHVETPMIYTHVIRDMVSVPKSPLDHLYIKKQP